MPTPNSLYDQKFHVVPHFDYLGKTNGVVPLMMTLTSHDSNAAAIGVI